MRIIAGKYGGRVLKLPKRLPVRPTTDRTREALFNILVHRLDLEGATVLDLFAGTGGISIECVSRGAGRVVAVDQHGKCIQALRQNLDLLGIEEVQVVRRDVFSFLQGTENRFDLIFADPPYDMPEQDRIWSLIRERSLLNPGGRFILEHRAAHDHANWPGFEERRDYGDSAFSFFSLPEPSTPPS